MPQQTRYKDTATEALPNGSYHTAQNTSGTNTIKTNYGIPSGKRIAANPPKLLLDDADVHRWYDNMRRSSSHNADVCLRRLNLFCDRTKVTPSGLASMGEASLKNVEDRMLDHVTWMEKCDYSPSYIAGVIKSIKSWLAHNRVDIRRRIRITDAGACTTISDEKVPEQGQLRDMLASATPRGRP